MTQKTLKLKYEKGPILLYKQLTEITYINKEQFKTIEYALPLPIYKPNQFCTFFNELKPHDKQNLVEVQSASLSQVWCHL